MLGELKNYRILPYLMGGKNLRLLTLELDQLTKRERKPLASAMG